MTMRCVDEVDAACTENQSVFFDFIGTCPALKNVWEYVISPRLSIQDIKALGSTCREMRTVMHRPLIARARNVLSSIKTPLTDAECMDAINYMEKLPLTMTKTQGSKCFRLSGKDFVTFGIKPAQPGMLNWNVPAQYNTFDLIAAILVKYGSVRNMISIRGQRKHTKSLAVEMDRLGYINNRLKMMGRPEWNICKNQMGFTPEKVANIDAWIKCSLR